MRRRSSAMASASTSAASSAWFAEKAWTVQHWRYMTRKSTANPATARSMVQKATATVRAPGHSTWTEERDWASSSLRPSLTDRPQTQTRQNLLRNLEDQRNALDVETLCMQQRGLWEQGSRGIRTVSVVQSVGRAWSRPHRRRRRERSTAKPVMPRTSALKASDMAKVLVRWSTLSNPTSITFNRKKNIYILCTFQSNMESLMVKVLYCAIELLFVVVLLHLCSGGFVTEKCG